MRSRCNPLIRQTWHYCCFTLEAHQHPRRHSCVRHSSFWPSSSRCRRALCPSRFFQAGPRQAGAPGQMLLTYESSIPDSNPNPNIGIYDQAILDLSLTFGSISFSLVPDTPNRLCARRHADEHPGRRRVRVVDGQRCRRLPPELPRRGLFSLLPAALTIWHPLQACRRTNWACC